MVLLGWVRFFKGFTVDLWFGWAAAATRVFRKEPTQISFFNKNRHCSIKDPRHNRTLEVKAGSKDTRYDPTPKEIHKGKTCQNVVQTQQQHQLLPFNDPPSSPQVKRKREKRILSSSIPFYALLYRLARSLHLFSISDRRKKEARPNLGTS